MYILFIDLKVERQAGGEVHAYYNIKCELIMIKWTGGNFDS